MHLHNIHGEALPALPVVQCDLFLAAGYASDRCSEDRCAASRVHANRSGTQASAVGPRA